MKKQLWVGVILGIALGMSGCGNSKQLEADKESLLAENESLKAENESLSAAKNDLQTLVYGTVANDDSSKNVSETTSSEPETTADDKQTDTQFAFDETISVPDIAEITFTSCEWQDQILPSNTSGVYSYYDDQEGETYLVFRGTVKNLATEAFDIDDATDAEIIVNGKYKFPVQIACEGTEGKDFYGDPKPLQELNMVAYASVTDEVKNQFSHGVLTINVLSDASRLNYYVRVEEEPHKTFVMGFDMK